MKKVDLKLLNLILNNLPAPLPSIKSDEELQEKIKTSKEIRLIIEKIKDFQRDIAKIFKTK